jgi:hypothetical protein
MTNPADTAIAVLWAWISGATMIVLRVDASLILLSVLGSLTVIAKREEVVVTLAAKTRLFTSWVACCIGCAVLASFLSEFLAWPPRGGLAAAFLFSVGGTPLLLKIVESIGAGCEHLFAKLTGKGNP